MATAAQYRWSSESASVVCRELGYRTAGISYVMGDDDNNDGAELFILGIDCRGNEVALAECANRGLSPTRPPRSKVVRVNCEIGE